MNILNRRGRMLVATVAAVGAATALAGAQALMASGNGPKADRSGGTSEPQPDYELEKKIPPSLDVFDLNLAQTRAFSASKNFEVVGHSYLKGPWLTPFARERGTGAGFNVVRVSDGIAYLAGYTLPPTVFGVVIADVRDPKNIRPLSFIPCEPGARCAYLRLNEDRDILVIGSDPQPGGEPPPAGGVEPGFSFYDVSDPANPKRLGFFPVGTDGATHGFDIDDRYVYGCATHPNGKGAEELRIVDYADPTQPIEVGNLHIAGQRQGEDFAPADQLNPDGTPQVIQCHEVVYRDGVAYVGWRDAGMVLVDVEDRSTPTIISRLDYVPPFNGGFLGAAHTSAPVVTGPARPNLVVQTDEIFGCPPGFGRIVDISVLDNPQVISSFRIPAISDTYDFATGQFRCEEGLQSAHLPWFDYRSPSLVYVTWYDQGLRAFDISNPFLPREVGYYISPKYAFPDWTNPPAPFFAGAYRASREVYQDPETGLIYLTDGNGGGLTILRWAGPVPETPPIPGAR